MATALFGIGLSAGAWAGQAPSAPGPAQARISYSVGYQFGMHLRGLERQGMAVDLQPLLQGILAALAGSTPTLSADEMATALATVAGTGPERDAAEATDASDPGQPPPQVQPPARQGGYVDDFAALNARRTGVVRLASGLQYEVLRTGSGRQPRPADTVAVRYQGTLTNGVVFDSTDEEDEPASLRLDEIVVPGLREALLLMPEGAKWRVVIPPHLGFGSSGNNLLRKRDLIYEIELVSVHAAAAPGVSGVEPTGADAAAGSQGKAGSAETEPPR